METQDFSDATAIYNISKNRYTSKVAGMNYCMMIVCALCIWFTFIKQVTTAECSYDKQELKDLTTSMPTLLM